MLLLVTLVLAGIYLLVERSGGRPGKAGTLSVCSCPSGDSP